MHCGSSAPEALSSQGLPHLSDTGFPRYQNRVSSFQIPALDSHLQECGSDSSFALANGMFLSTPGVGLVPILELLPQLSWEKSILRTAPIIFILYIGKIKYFMKAHLKIQDTF